MAEAAATGQPETLVIELANPEIVYVPSYNPSVVPPMRPCESAGHRLIGEGAGMSVGEIGRRISMAGDGDSPSGRL
jgi:hypothetical protein